MKPLLLVKYDYLKDLDSISKLAKLKIRGEYTKTKVDRYVFLTREVKEQIKIWLDYKDRTRRICYKDKETERSITEYRNPEKNQDEFIFPLFHYDNNINHYQKYYLVIYGLTLDRIGMGSEKMEMRLDEKSLYTALDDL